MRSAFVVCWQLHASGGWLVQPFSVNGTEPSTGPQWYGSGDFHDANRVNNKRQIPILLDFVRRKRDAFPLFGSPDVITIITIKIMIAVDRITTRAMRTGLTTSDGKPHDHSIVQPAFQQ